MSTNQPSPWRVLLFLITISLTSLIVDSSSNPSVNNVQSIKQPEVHQYSSQLSPSSSEESDPREQPAQSPQSPVHQQSNVPQSNVQQQQQQILNQQFSHRSVVPMPYSPFQANSNPMSNFNSGQSNYGPNYSNVHSYYGQQSSSPSSVQSPNQYVQINTQPSSINSITPKPVPRLFQTTPMIEPIINPYLAQLLSSYSVSSPQVIEAPSASSYYSGLMKDSNPNNNYVRLPYFSPSFIPGQLNPKLPDSSKKSNFLRRILFSGSSASSSDFASTDEEEDEAPRKKAGFFQRRKGNSFLRGPLKWFFVRRDNEEEETAESSNDQENEPDSNGLQTNFRGNVAGLFKNNGAAGSGSHHPLGPEFDSLGPGTFLNYNGELMFIPVGSMNTFRSLNSMSGVRAPPQYMSYGSGGHTSSDLMATSESLLSALWKLIKK